MQVLVLQSPVALPEYTHTPSNKLKQEHFNQFHPFGIDGVTVTMVQCDVSVEFDTFYSVGYLAKSLVM